MMTRSARRHASSILVGVSLASACLTGCGQGEIEISPRETGRFAAKTKGKSGELVAHLQNLDKSQVSQNGDDLDQVRKNFVAYTQAIVETADTVLDDEDAPEADVISAARSKLVALERQAEFAEEERPRLLAAVKAMEEGKHAAILKPQTTIYKLRALCEDITRESLRLLTPEKFSLLVDATLDLGRLDPPREEAPAVLFQVATEAENRNLSEKAAALYGLTAERFPDSEFGKFAPGCLARVEAKGKPLTDISGPGPRPREGEGEAPTVSLDDLKGKVVLIDYWATWCGPCLAETDRLKDLHRRLSPEGFEILGINLDDRPEQLRSYLREQKITWPQIMGFGDQRTPWDAPLATRFGIHALPYKLLVDRQGNLIATSETLEGILPRLDAQFAEATQPEAADPPADPSPAPGEQPARPAADAPGATPA